MSSETHLQRIKRLRDQCQAAGVSFFFKQWGEWAPRLNVTGVTLAENVEMHRLGKKRAGRLLDGREWNEFPVQKKESFPRCQHTIL